ncbi:MAG: T9SS type A sorting domain-containing protein [FCB group bacterium]|jgi:hypothetical protein
MKTLFTFLLALIVCFSATHSAVYLVGAGKQYTLPSQVMSKVSDGDTVLIDAGTYTGDVGYWTKNNLLIRGVGGFAHLAAGGKNAGGKGIWVVDGRNTTIEYIEFSGCTVADQNGAGIRQEGDTMTVRHCYFHDNDEGILTNNNRTNNVLIEFSEFNHNGFGDGYSHNLYIGTINSFTFRFNYSHRAYIGHNLKSRANYNYILYNRFADEADGQSSLLVDLPQGGLSYIIGNVLVKGANAQNQKLLSYGEENLNNTDNRIYIVNNTFVNKRSIGVYVYLQAGIGEAKSINNIFTGNSAEDVSYFKGTATLTNNLRKNNISDVEFTDEANYDYTLMIGSPAIDAGTDPGSINGYSLLPVYEYKHPCDSVAKKLYDTIDIGAYEYAKQQSNFFTITATAGTGGTINPNGKVSVTTGQNQQFTISANKNYAILDVKVDNVSVGSISSYTFTNVTANHTIDAEFVESTIPVAKFIIDTSQVVSGTPFDITVKLFDKTTGNPYYPNYDIVLQVEVRGKGVLSGNTSGTLSQDSSEVIISNIIYTKDDGEMNVIFAAWGASLSAPLCSDTVNVLAKEPTIQDSYIMFSNFTPTSLSLDWSIGNGAKRLGILKTTSYIDSTELPIDGMNYIANNAYGSGQRMGNKDCYVIYNGTNTNINISGLDVIHQTFYVMICAYNGDSLTANYNIKFANGNPNELYQWGVNDNKSASSGFEICNIAPEPVKDVLHFTLITERMMPITIELLDINGRTALTAYAGKTFDPGSTEINIHVNTLPAGVYLVKVSSGNSFAFTKVIIAR